MSAIIIRGGRPLSGSLTVQGAKNSVLPILAATLLSGEVCRIRHCPRLRDVETAMEILRHLGCRADWQGRDLLVDAADLTRWDVPDHLMSRMRSSVVFLGAILARCGQAEMTYPGGCELGARPIDLHLAALRSMGAAIQETGGRLACRRERLTGTEIVLSLPSVGATENAMLAACGAEGTTVIANAAREPEIVDLQTFLQKMGAHVQGAGSSTVVVRAAHPSMAAYIRWWRTALWPLPIWRPPPAPAAISGWRAWTTVTSPPLPRCCVRRDAASPAARPPSACRLPGGCKAQAPSARLRIPAFPRTHRRC